MVNLTYILAQIEVGGESKNFVDSIPTEFLWAIGAVFLSVYFLVTTLRKVRRSQLRSQRTVSQRVDELHPRLGPMQAQINELMAELADLSRQINGQIDTRVAKLEILLDEAERTISRLEGQSGARSESDISDSFRHGATHKQSVTNTKGAASESGAFRQEWANLPKNHIANEQETQSVLGLDKQGKSAIAIAQELDRPVGEIELILALNKK